MTSRGHPPPPALHRDDMRAALDLFDESLEILARHLPEASKTEIIADTPLPNLLEQCQERVAAARKRRGPRLLIVMPGLVQAEPDWWRDRTRGLDFCTLASGWVGQLGLQTFNSAGRQRILSAMVQQMHSESARHGRDLLVLASPQMACEVAFSPTDQLLLVGHPWRVFAEGEQGGHSLEGMCRAMLRLLEDMPGISVLRIEGDRLTEAVLGPAEVISGEPGLAALTVLGLEGSWHGGADGHAGSQVQTSGLPDPSLWVTVPAYVPLCRRLGYDPALDHSSAGAEDIVTGMVARHASALTFVKRIERVGVPNWSVRTADLHQLMRTLDTVLSSGEDIFVDRLDAATRSLPWCDGVLLQLMSAAHFAVSGNAMQGLSLVAEAVERIPERAEERSALIRLAASLCLEMNNPKVALQTLLSEFRGPDGLSAIGQKALAGIIGAPDAETPDEHGQSLLLRQLAREIQITTGRKKLMVEIGTTRETVPGQGSTRQLARLCAREGIDFVTVDMDPRNSRNAMRMFRKLGLPFQAVTAKGEDWLAVHQGPIDYIFLDAYDFDHGLHSELRQGRYERYLGSRIDDAACHQMHLDCAKALVERLAPDGLICFDDTWTDENGLWTAKGTTAMPFLLDHGFEVIEARNRAALLRRVDQRHRPNSAHA